MAKIPILLPGSLGSSGAHNCPFSKFQPSSSGLVERAIEYLDLTQPPDLPSSGLRSRAPSHRPPWWRLHRLSFLRRCCPHPISPLSPPQHRWHRSGNALAMRTGATVRAAPSGSQTFKAKDLAEKLPEVLDFPKDLVSLESASKAWNVYGVLNYLQALVEKSQIIQILEREKEGLEQFTATDGYDYEGGSSNVLKMLGYYSMVGLLRVHCLLGDYHTGLKCLAPIAISQQGVYTIVIGSHISTIYHYGFANLMLRRSWSIPAVVYNPTFKSAGVQYCLIWMHYLHWQF